MHIFVLSSTALFSSFQRLIFYGFPMTLSMSMIVFLNIFVTEYIYIHNIIGHYIPSVRIIDLVSHTTYVVCINFIHTWRDYCLKSTPNDRFFEKLFMAILFALRIFATNLLRGNRTFRILIWCLAWGSDPGFTSNKPTHYLQNYGDFSVTIDQ